jgi:hypothetical protein
MEEKLMAETLGKIEKPEAEQFKKGRKLYFVPVVLPHMDADKEFADLTAKYWKEAREQLENLETKLSNITYVYHEMMPDKDGIKRLAELGIGSSSIVSALLDRGAKFIEIEEKTILDEYTDWSRCLSINLSSPAVFNKCYNAYLESSKKREEHIAKRIDETLAADEAAVLFMREGHHVQFPSDIRVFYVAPPALDAVRRMLRDIEEAEFKRHSEAQPKKPEPGARPEPEDKAEG